MRNGIGRQTRKGRTLPTRTTGSPLGTPGIPGSRARSREAKARTAGRATQRTHRHRPRTPRRNRRTARKRELLHPGGSSARLPTGKSTKTTANRRVAVTASGTSSKQRCQRKTTRDFHSLECQSLRGQTVIGVVQNPRPYPFSVYYVSKNTESSMVP